MPITIRNLDNPGVPGLLTPTTNAAPQAADCCGGEAPAGIDACCAQDAEVKAAGGSGCDCDTSTDAAAVPAASVASAAKGCC